MKLPWLIGLSGTLCGCAGADHEEWEWDHKRANRVGLVATLARDVLVVEDYREGLVCRGTRFADCDSLVRWLAESDGAVWSNGVLVCGMSLTHASRLDALVRFCRVNGVPLHRYFRRSGRRDFDSWVDRLADPCPGVGDGTGPGNEVLRRYGMELDDWTKEAGRALRGEPAGR